MELVKQAYLKGERALFKSHDLKVEDSIFADGESPLKESDHIDISGSIPCSDQIQVFLNGNILYGIVITSM